MGLQERQRHEPGVRIAPHRLGGPSQAFRDFPFPDEAPLYPSHQRVAAYLRAQHFDVLDFVGFFNVSGGGGNIRMMDVRAAWIAALAGGDVLPPTMT